MRRRDFVVAGLGGLTAASFPFAWRKGFAAGQRKKRVLYFTRSAGFEHSVVRRQGDELAHSEKILVELGEKGGFEVICTKDGRVFDEDLGKFDAIVFYTSGDLTKPDKLGTPPMSEAGKKRLLDAIAAGKGFIGFHAATDSFHSRGDQIDPYIAMIGGEFITHGRQQEAALRNTSPKFPGMAKIGPSLRLLEEWYALKNFAPDLHVIFVQETEGMVDDCYQRPPFPATWARMHGKGRVYYTSLGHREDIWTNPVIQDIFLGAFAWVLGQIDADIPPNIQEVTPLAHQLRR
jgi:type 1 glutamine amidotransferase